MEKEIVTGVALVGNQDELTDKLASVLIKEYDFFIDADEKPFSGRIAADRGSYSDETESQFHSFDGKVETWSNGAQPGLYVENGLVFPEDVPAIRIPVNVNRAAGLVDNQAQVQIQPQGKIPGVFFVMVDAELENGERVDSEHVVFLDGHKVARAIGAESTVVEKGVLKENGEFVLKESAVRPEGIVKKQEKKSVIEQNMEAGLPERINDMGTGLNRVYMKAFQGDFDRIRNMDMFPRDLNAACPILADTKVNLGNTTLMGISIPAMRDRKHDVSIEYMPATLELNLSHFENAHRAYGPALAKDMIPGHPREGTTYYMDVTSIGDDALQKLHGDILTMVDEHNRMKGQRPDLTEAILKKTMEAGAKSPVLAIGKAFDEVVLEREAQKAREKEEELARKEQAEKELEARNEAIKEEVAAKKKRGEHIQEETRYRIYVHKPVKISPVGKEPYLVSLLEPPDKDNGEDYYKLKCKAGYREIEVRIPKASKELGQDGKPLSFVKKTKNPFSDYDYVICVSPKLGNQFPVYCNGMPTDRSFGYSEISGYFSERYKELQEHTNDIREGNSKYGVLINDGKARDTTAKGSSLNPHYRRKRNYKGNNGVSDGNSGR